MGRKQTTRRAWKYAAQDIIARSGLNNLIGHTAAGREWLQRTRKKIRYFGICDRCELPFTCLTTLSTPQRTCSPQCSQALRRKRTRQRNANTKAAWGGTPCPHPTKQVYPSKVDAEERLAVSWSNRNDMNAYLCSCGFWHLGHRWR